MEKMKIGIIGLGKAWEWLHAPAYERLCDKFQITAVCDHDINQAQAAAKWMGLEENAAFDDYKRMLKEADICAVDTIVPIHQNFECAKAVIESGKHLLAEKPFASTVKEAKELIHLKDKYQVKVLVAEQFRYDEANVIIKNLISENRIGNPIYFIDNYVTEFQKEMLESSFANTEWRKHPDFKGGIFLDTAVHHFARHRFIFGRVNSVYAAGRPSKVDFAPYSCINAMLTFENNIAGHYTFYAIGRETQAPFVGFRIFGTGGEIYLEDKCCGFVNISYKDGGHEAIPYKQGEGFYHELNNFYEAVANGAEIISTPEKELGDIKIVTSVLDSIEKDIVIKPDDDYVAQNKGGKSSNPIAS